MLILPPVLFQPVIAAEHQALMQVGPDPSPMQPSTLPIPRRKPVVAPVTGTAPPPPAPSAVAGSPKQQSRFTECLAAAKRDPAAGLAAAKAWLAEGPSPEARVAAQLCLGQILSQQSDFAGAEAAFGEAAGGLPAEQAAASVPLLAMAGNAALAAGQGDRAVTWFDKALAVPGVTDNAALGAVQIDRSRALVAAGRLGEAGGALDEAHRLVPQSAEGWLLSATLARRNKDLARAQRDIEIADGLDTRDPAIGVEAGVIAVLSGRDEAARKSWESVVKAAPGSEEAKTAASYLEQLGAAPTSVAPPPETKK